MTLEEAIRHCEEVAEEYEDSIGTEVGSRYSLIHDKNCMKCASEHRLLADWLKLLKRILDSGDCNECGIKKYCQVAPPLGEQVRYNCPLFVRKEQEEGEQ